MSSKPLKVNHLQCSSLHILSGCLVIARNALVQEESDEFGGDFNDPMIDLNLDRDRDGCAC